MGSTCIQPAVNPNRRIVWMNVRHTKKCTELNTEISNYKFKFWIKDFFWLTNQSIKFNEYNGTRLVMFHCIHQIYIFGQLYYILYYRYIMKKIYIYIFTQQVITIIHFNVFFTDVTIAADFKKFRSNLN